MAVHTSRVLLKNVFHRKTPPPSPLPNHPYPVRGSPHPCQFTREQFSSQALKLIKSKADLKCSVFLSCNLRLVLPIVEILAVPTTASLINNPGHLSRVRNSRNLDIITTCISKGAVLLLFLLLL